MCKEKNKTCNRNNSGKKKVFILLSSVLLLVSLFVGTTVAFLIDIDGPIINIFNPTQIFCEVTEDTFDGETKTNVIVKNTGDTEAYIRAAIVVTWKDEVDGNVYGGKPEAGIDYYIEINNEEWFKGNDGFYYYKKPIAAGISTAALIKECTAVKEKTPVGYGLNVEILGSAIQSVPKTVVKEKWGVIVSDDGTLTPGE